MSRIKDEKIVNTIEELENYKSIIEKEPLRDGDLEYIDLDSDIDENEVENRLIEIKNEYKDATHYCYAYIIDNVKRFNDDSEPSGTAGVPMLNVLESNNLNHILTVTVRYFGGIKLGAGGLVRAYTKSVTENLKDLKICEFVDGFEFDVKIPYELKDFFELSLKEYVQNKYYDNFINYRLCVKVEKIDELKLLFDKYDIKIENLKEIKIKK